MAKVQKSIEVSKEADELVQALVGLAGATKQALADGFQPGQDIPAIVLEAYQKLPVALQGAAQIPLEAQEDLVAFVKAMTNGAADLLGVVKG